MSLVTYDIILLVLFVIFISGFLYTKRKNLKKDGLLFLYKTKWGIKVIDKIGKKYKKTLGFLSYVSIGLGYVLMATMLWMFGKIVYLYVAFPEIVKAIKIPPIMPLVPYINRLAPGIGLPEFYFIYFILILAIVAVFHEFAHGIFMRRYDIKIKSTGFGFFPFFLPVFLAAFVEQDEESMKKASRFKQMAVLSAGTFANVITAIVAFIVMVLFFMVAYTPGGVVFDNYAYTPLGISGINSVNNISFENKTYGNLLSSLNDEGMNELKTSNGTYLLTKNFLEMQGIVEENIWAYADSPAARTEITGAIVKINGVAINGLEELSEELDKYSPGEEVALELNNGDEMSEENIVLGENPFEEGQAWLGITFETKNTNNALGKIISKLNSFKDPYVIYQPKWALSEFIYRFFWLLALISFSVALVNMLPMGIFDGGRFFYLTILGITKSEKKAKNAFKFITYFLLGLLAVVMFFWAYSFIK